MARRVAARAESNGALSEADRPSRRATSPNISVGSFASWQAESQPASESNGALSEADRPSRRATSPNISVGSFASWHAESQPASESNGRSEEHTSELQSRGHL